MRRLPFILILVPMLVHGQTNINWTNIPQATFTQTLTSQILGSTNGITPVRRIPLSLLPFDAAGAANAATNVFGSAAYKNTSFFDLSGAALDATNGLWGAALNFFQFGSANLTNWSTLPTNVLGSLVAASVAASNVFSGGELADATITTNSPFATAFLGFTGSRSWIDFSNITHIAANALLSESSSSQFLGAGAGQNAVGVTSDIFLGANAGQNASNSLNNIYIGPSAGLNAGSGFGPLNCIFIGNTAGKNANVGNSAVFIGSNAGQNATNSPNGFYLGPSAGGNAWAAGNSFFAGNTAGQNANAAANSMFVGASAGKNSTNASKSIFLGPNSGTNRANTLWIDTQSSVADGSYQALILGYFDLRKLFINGSLNVTGAVTGLSFTGDGSGITNLPAASSVAASNVFSGGQLPLGTVSGGLDSSIAGPMLTTNGTARFYSYNAGGLTNLQPAGMASGTFSVPLYTSDSSTTNAPLDNQLVAARWVRNLFNVGADYFSTTNIVSGTNADTPGQPLYSFQATIPQPAAIQYTTADYLTNNGYFASIVTTNTFQAFSGNAVQDAYLAFTGGGGGPTLSMHPEIYYSYDKTNWLGNFSAQATTIIPGQTNLYQWAIGVPLITSTNAQGFYIQRRYKVNSVTGTGLRTLTILRGTNLISGPTTAAHVTMESPTATTGNAFLAANQTFTGTNTFSQTIQGTATNATTSTWSTNLAAPSLTAWSGPTNSLAMSYPASWNTYTMTSDISVTNLTDVSAGVPGAAVFILTNSAASNCTARFPASWVAYGASIVSSSVTVTAAKKAIISINTENSTNYVAVTQSN